MQLRVGREREGEEKLGEAGRKRGLGGVVRGNLERAARRRSDKISFMGRGQESAMADSPSLPSFLGHCEAVRIISVAV